MYHTNAIHQAVLHGSINTHYVQKMPARGTTTTGTVISEMSKNYKLWLMVTREAERKMIEGNKSISTYVLPAGVALLLDTDAPTSLPPSLPIKESIKSFNGANSLLSINLN